MRIGLPARRPADPPDPSRSRAACPRAASSACRRPCRTACRSGGAGFGYGGLKRKPPGTSTVPSSTCSRWIARQVWKPFEWAEMPRMACIATGRPAHRLVAAAGPIGPGDRQFDRLARTRRARVLRRCGGSCRPGCRSARRPLRANSWRRDSGRRSAGRPARSGGRSTS